MNTVGKGLFWAVVVTVGLVVVGISTLENVGGHASSTEPTASASDTQIRAVNTEKTPDQVVDEMHVVFKGQPDSKLLMRVTTHILRVFDKPLTGQSYMHLADVTEEMQQRIAPSPETDLLSCVDDLGSQRAQGMGMEKAFALCAVMIQHGEYTAPSADH